MRFVWVHGSYMEALDRDLLAAALELQDELLDVTENFNPLGHAGYEPLPETDTGDFDLSPGQRDSVHAINGMTNESWFFNSPLQYWGCSRQRILADPDVVSTVNDMKNLTTTVNVTLRHSVVFSGKRFQYRRLLAADALVITLLHLKDSPVGQQWERKAAALAERVSDRWDVYPPDGRISTSRPYEFQFRPMSTQDTLTLTLAYGLAISYFVMSLLKVRAVKSKVGIMITVVTQIIFAIMSSFTVCAIFNIDLSRIPRAAYPLVILAMSLENIFRLINAVIQTPSEDSTASRIGHAVGETAPVALISTSQNVLILIILSRMVSSGVSAFCIFLAVAIVFDIFYLSTFFLSVLSVDVRRTELSDALAKVSMRQHRQIPEARGWTWIEQVIHGKTALSTRIAGTFVMFGFIVIAQWHFFQQQVMLNSTIELFWNSATSLFRSSNASMLEGINQARSPTSWLRLQDHETAKELINVVKPSAHSYIAQVYDPLVFVKKGSDRTRRNSEPPLLPAYYDFINHQLTQFVVIVVLIVAALRLLISYLLYEDEANMEDERDYEDLPLLSVNHLPEGHSLDIALMGSSTRGHVISVGLDRRICVWNIRCGKPHYTLPDISPRPDGIFPVLGVATDDSSKWLAIVSPSRVTFWSLADQKWGPSASVRPLAQRPEAVFFAPKTPHEAPRLVIVRRTGTVTEMSVEEGCQPVESVICESSVQCAEPLIIRGTAQHPPRLFIISASKTGYVHVSLRTEVGWKARPLPVSLPGEAREKVHQIVAMHSLGLFIVATSTHAHIFNVEDCETLYTAEMQPMRPRSLECAYTTQRIAHIDMPSITSATMTYVDAATGDCILHTFTPSEDWDAIGLRAPSGATDGEGCEWIDATVTKRRVRNPGHYRTLSDGSVVGIRRKQKESLPCSPSDSPTSQSVAEGGLRKRFLSSRNSISSGSGNDAASLPEWEVWTISPSNRIGADEEEPLFKADERSSHLLISDIGPKVTVGLMSVAFSFGNVVKVVTVGGTERFDNMDQDDAHDVFNIGHRRRKTAASWKLKTWS
ncbi:Sterol-sensing domain of SREBP cleavage-activation [Geosmithia morbida]|uniref:Sterol regulatory element-binding protein cleavage-activating protein n=1 Tax=Geosmithia morbida TaxID=1094350 RepID=A0A9P5CY97_9HYPO|nr:Sterol-sensing domain of SREBP cleavage-activation [Geosmithia morbida]KAF4120153.1 Sterol-sensing domain of SREBP cleavage-activation [Geosmithia morbida]